MARKNVLLSDAQWKKIEPLLPKLKKNPRGGRPWASNRDVFVGILWVLKTGARWRDVPEPYPSGVTCWRRLKMWEEEDVWLDMWRAFLGQLDRRGRLDWSESFADESFAPAKQRGSDVGNTKRGKGSKWLVVVDGKGIPLGGLIASASPGEVTLLEAALATIRVPRSGPGRPRSKPTRVIADRAYDSDPHRERLARRGIEPIVPFRKNRKWPGIQYRRPLRRYRKRWKVERTNAWISGFRRLVTRYDHRVEHYRAFFYIACAMITMRWL